MQADKTTYFPAITGLRAIAAYLVFFHHLPLGISLNKVFLVQREFHIGVSIFYVLSGFLIASRYYAIDLLSFSAFKKFFQNRFARIYPLYFVLLSATLIVAPISWGAILLNYTLLKGFFADAKFSGIAQAWSLSVEETFYIIAPFIFLSVQKRGSIFTIILCVLLSVLIFLIFNYLIIFKSFLLGVEFYLSYTFFGRVFEFLAGIFTFLLFKKEFNLKNGTFIGIFGIGAIVLILFFLGGDTYFEYGIFTIKGIIANNLVLPFFIGSLIIGLIKEKTFLSNILATKFFDLLGKSSYAFYLLHAGVLTFVPLSIFLKSHNLFQIETLVIVVYFIIIQIASIFAYKFIEKPFNLLLRARK